MYSASSTTIPVTNHDPDKANPALTVTATVTMTLLDRTPTPTPTPTLTLMVLVLTVQGLNLAARTELGQFPNPNPYSTGYHLRDLQRARPAWSGPGWARARARVWEYGAEHQGLALKR